MAKYKVYAGVRGRLGGATYRGIFESSEREIEELAWQLACEEFEKYEGLHSFLPSYGEILEEFEEDGLDNAEDAAWEVFCEERDSWLDYYYKKVEE